MAVPAALLRLEQQPRCAGRQNACDLRDHLQLFQETFSLHMS